VGGAGDERLKPGDEVIVQGWELVYPPRLSDHPGVVERVAGDVVVVRLKDGPHRNLYVTSPEHVRLAPQ
jgi:hypothetical protein